MTERMVRFLIKLLDRLENLEEKMEYVIGDYSGYIEDLGYSSDNISDYEDEMWEELGEIQEMIKKEIRYLEENPDEEEEW